MDTAPNPVQQDQDVAQINKLLSAPPSDQPAPTPAADPDVAKINQLLHANDAAKPDQDPDVAKINSLLKTAPEDPDVARINRVLSQPGATQPIPQAAPAPPDTTWQKVKAFAQHPLVSAGDLIPGAELPILVGQYISNKLNDSGHASLAKVADAYVGAEKAGEDAASGMTSPLNLGIMLATGGLGTVENATAQVAAKLGLSPEAIAVAAKYGPVVSRLINGGFSIQGLKQAYDNLPEIKKSFDAGDAQKTAQLLASTAGTVAMSGYAGLHALGSVNPTASSETPKTKAEPLSNAKFIDFVDSDAAKVYAENKATIQEPLVTPKAESESETKTESEPLPAARIVKEDYVPTISRDQILAEATQRIADNSPILRNLVDPSKLNSPEDINAALKDAAGYIRSGLDPRVGARVSWDESKALAADLGMSVEDLLSRKSGAAFGPEESIAARGLLKASADNVIELSKAAVDGNEAAKTQAATALARHTEITNQIAAVKSEAGRSLSSLKIQDADLPQIKIADAVSKLDPATQQKAFQLLSKIDPAAPDYVRQVNQFVEEITPSTTNEKLFEIYRNGLLSGPATVIKKGVSEAAMQALEITKKALVGGAEAAKTAVGMQDTPEAYGSEAYWYARGAAQALTHADDILSGRLSVADDPTFEHFDNRAVPGKIGELIRIPSQILQKQTTLVHAMSYFGELNSLAARQAIKEGLSGPELEARQDYLVHNPTPELIQGASDMARNQTFQNKLNETYGDTVEKFDQAVANSKFLKYWLPFRRTPLNLFRQAYNYSPAGLLHGTVTSDLPLQVKGAIGSSLAAAIYYLALEGKISGGGPLDFKKRETKEETGFQPYSVNLNGKWYSFRRAEPLGLPLSLAADLAHAVKNDEEPASIQARGANLVGHLTRATEDLPFLMTFGGIVDALTHLGKDSTAERYLDNLLAGAVVPAGVKDVAQAVDRTVRSPKREGLLTNPATGLVQTIQSRIPGLTSNVRPEIGVTGQPIQRPASSLGGAWPFPVTTEKNDPVISELARLGVSAEKPPTKTRGKNIEAPSTDESTKLQQIEQQQFYDLASRAISNPRWADVPEAEKMKVLKHFREIISKARPARLAQMRAE